jgi:hypothetical protein
MEIGIGLAAVVALMTNLASLLKHRGCQHAHPVSLGQPLASLRCLAASPWFAAGWGLAGVAWLAHVAALSLAPILVFGDPLFPSPLGMALQITALAMVCLSALLLPSSIGTRRLEPA